jgi:two-component system, NtrC family, response regulator PilR
VGKILVVDDEQSMREFLTICLRRAGHTPTVARDAKEAFQQLRDNAFDLVLTDLNLPGDTNGIGILSAIKNGEAQGAKSGQRFQAGDPEVVLMTAYASAATAIEAMKQGAYDYLTKPFNIDEINAVIARALEKRALVEENIALRERIAGRIRLGDLLGKSRAMHNVFDLISKIHSTRTNVLITGESGTGKELVARALHTEGVRATQRFVAVNCSAIPDELLESELFGHTKGSFTGAIADRPGLFQQADGGTLFLDEIGELSPALQVKLLRALQERKIKPVGASEEIEVDVRVIAATNRDLEAEVSRGAFRGDLYYRLNVVEVHIPPLRQRREDIQLLTDHFLKSLGKEHHRTLSITNEGMQWLERYNFPGNVRELENIIERAVALSTSSTIGVADLPDIKSTKSPIAVPTQFPPDGIQLDQVLSDIEREWVQLALTEANGVRKRAASSLGISFRSFRYRLAKLGYGDDKVEEDEK